MKHDDNRCDELEDAFNVNNRIIKELKRELKDCREQLNDALRYGFQKNQENTVLHWKMAQLYIKKNRGLEDGKNR